MGGPLIFGMRINFKSLEEPKLDPRPAFDLRHTTEGQLFFATSLGMVRRIQMKSACRAPPHCQSLADNRRNIKRTEGYGSCSPGDPRLWRV
jgi:hypothetical protein